MIFLLTFILICILITFIVIIPNIKTYKKVKNEYEKSHLLYGYISDDFKDINKRLIAFKRDNKKVLNSLSNNFVEEDFIKNSEKFFDLVSLKKETAVTDKEFNIYDLNITMSMKTPQSFYDFMEGLGRYDNVVQVDFPILMKADKDTINTFFKIKVFHIVN